MSEWMNEWKNRLEVSILFSDMVASRGIEKRLFPGVRGAKAKLGMFGEVSTILENEHSCVDKVAI